MKKSNRIVLSVIGALISLFCIYFPLSFGFQDIEKDIRQIAALIIAFIIGLFLWLMSKGTSKKFGNQVFKTALIVGVIGFVLGFIGPIILSPDSNQGPLLGIFITGPSSFLIGLIGGAIYWKNK